MASVTFSMSPLSLLSPPLSATWNISQVSATTTYKYKVCDCRERKRIGCPGAESVGRRQIIPDKKLRRSPSPTEQTPTNGQEKIQEIYFSLVSFIYPVLINLTTWSYLGHPIQSSSTWDDDLPPMRLTFSTYQLKKQHVLQHISFL